MVKEIDKPKADIVHLEKATKRFLQDNDIHSLKFKLLELANQIESVKDKTPWPNWSQNQADSMRDYANQLPDD